MSLQISRESFASLPPEEQSKILYDILSNISDKIDEFIEIHQNHMEKCDTRFRRIENRKIFDRGIAGMMGFLGGFIESLMKWK